MAQFRACACDSAPVLTRKKQQKTESSRPVVVLRCELKYHHSVWDDACARCASGYAYY